MLQQRRRLPAAAPSRRRDSRCGSCGSRSWARSHLLGLTSSSPLAGPMVAALRTFFTPSREQGTARGSSAPPCLLRLAGAPAACGCGTAASDIGGGVGCLLSGAG